MVVEKMLSVHTHLHFLVSKEKENEEAGSSLQGQVGPPGLGLPAPVLQGVADNVGLGGVEARVEVDSDIGPGMQAAAALEVHLEPVCIFRDHSLEHDHLACTQAAENGCHIRNHRMEDRWLQDEDVRKWVQFFSR